MPISPHLCSCRNSVLTSVGTEVFIDSHQIRRRSPRPTSRLLPRGVLLPPAAPKLEPSPAQRWGPASSPGAHSVAGQGPGHGVPPTPLRAARPGSFCGRNSRSLSPRADSAAGLLGSDTRGEIRPPPRPHQDLRRRCSCADPGKKSCASLGRGICAASRAQDQRPGPVRRPCQS